MDLRSIATPQALGQWLATGPAITQRSHAFDQLVDEVGFDQALRTWRAGELRAEQR